MEQTEWTKTRPSEDGYYWYRLNSRRNAEIVLINRGVCWHSYDEDSATTPPNYGQWAGPLQPPAGRPPRSKGESRDTDKANRAMVGAWVKIHEANRS